jgi:hypothetical protein
MEANQGKFGALGSVLAKDISQIEDLPNYVAPPAGVYKLMIEECKQDVLNEKTVLKVGYVFLELKELNAKADDDDKAEVAKIQWGKDKMSELFYFDKPEKIETTLGVLKKKFGGLGTALGTTNLMEILEKMPNMTIEAQVGRRGDDNDSTKFYAYTRTIVAAA